MTNINIEIPNELHKRLKQTALDNEETIGKVVEKAVNKYCA